MITDLNVLRRGSVRVLGAASAASYNQYIADDDSLAGLFQSVIIDKDHETATSAANESRAFHAAQAFEGDKISPDLRELMRTASADGRIKAILQVDDVWSTQLKTLLKHHGVQISGTMSQLKTLQVEIPVKAIEALASSGLTNYISPDVPV